MSSTVLIVASALVLGAGIFAGGMLAASRSHPQTVIVHFADPLIVTIEPK
jgi:hypothetical protein